MTRPAVIELCHDSMKFSAGHFTIFSENVRENLHGHSYTVHASITTMIGDQGIAFDYRFYKKKFREICERLALVTLLPGNSPFLKIADKGDYYHAYFADETLIFLKRDVKILPVTNITLEELSNWILAEVLQDKTELLANKVQKIRVKVFNAPGHAGSTTWRLSQ
ncbi:hypothetical protein AYO45_05105 [Gammaproteobacteria bacterium SCGC AG-212-F23]|nr:hypothetical protein AYO45_05105 [Gammaproteobacteria bacterium SCGC AG-212-F23]